MAVHTNIYSYLACLGKFRNYNCWKDCLLFKDIRAGVSHVFLREKTNYSYHNGILTVGLVRLG
jgi:hypothetical protein